MNKKIAFIFPGQGAQYPGMGRDFFENFSEAQEVFALADQLLQAPFSQTIFEGPKEVLTLTKNSQLAIFIVSIAILRVVQSRYPDLQPSFCAGLSLGEYSALVASEKLSFEEALLLVKARGEWMQKACETHLGTMSVVLGLDLPVVKEALQEIADAWVANLNCPGQIVISGTFEGIEKASEILKQKKGARRIMPLDVSGAFHSGLMQMAQDHLAPLIQKTILKDSPVQMVMNVPGDKVSGLEEMRKYMLEQVTHPVRWQDCIEMMEKNGVEIFIEVGPGKTLSGMNKRIGVQSSTVSIEKIEDLEIIGNYYATVS